MTDQPDDRLRGYIVISTTLEGDDYEDCRVVPHGDPYPATYRQVYGPDSEKECKQWAAKNCKGPKK